MTSSDTITYDYSAVALIDVLGFSDIVRRSADDHEGRNTIYKILSLFESVRDDGRRSSNNILGTMSFFSDTFVLSKKLQRPSGDPDLDSFWRTIREIGKLGREILAMGLPCRGAVAVGLCHHQGDRIVGPALVRASDLEKSVAIYPRIILDDSALLLWQKYLGHQRWGPDEENKKSQWADAVKQDTDGAWYLDVFHSHYDGGLPWSAQPRNIEEVLEVISQTIERGLNRSADSPRIRAKYEWLNRHRARLGR
jgi:hypothetical protein